MPPSPLTPEQQAALDLFETDAQNAESAHNAKIGADREVLVANANQQQTTAADLSAHQAALESAKAFFDLMVPPTPPPPPVVSSQRKPS